MRSLVKDVFHIMSAQNVRWDDHSIHLCGRENIARRLSLSFLMRAVLTNCAATYDCIYIYILDRPLSYLTSWLHTHSLEMRSRCERCGISDFTQLLFGSEFSLRGAFVLMESSHSQAQADWYFYFMSFFSADQRAKDPALWAKMNDYLRREASLLSPCSTIAFFF